jgi:hypothetical protein
MIEQEINDIIIQGQLVVVGREMSLFVFFRTHERTVRLLLLSNYNQRREETNFF